MYETLGGGVFNYVAAYVNVNGSCRGTNAVLLGHRVVPEDAGIRNSVVVVNCADHGPTQVMTDPPSVGKIKYLKLMEGILEEIEPKMEKPDVTFR